MLDRLAAELFASDRESLEPAAVLHTELAHELESRNGETKLTIRVPFGERGELGLKKAGSELIVSVGPRKRTIILPAGLARKRPSGARLEDGALEVTFEDVGARAADVV
jgi:hypothetical protein